MSELTVERVGGSVRLSGSLDRGTHLRADKIAGVRFTGDAWDYPLTLSTCRALRAEFGRSLSIGPVLREWARAEIEKSSALGELALMKNAQLFNVTERINDAMETRSYQRVAAAFVADAGCCLVADQPGLGKTIELLAGVQEANPSGEGRLHLVFAPVVAVEAVWPGEIEHWIGAENAVAVPLRGTGPQRRQILENALAAHSDGIDTYIVANIEMARIKPEKNAKGKPEYHVRNALFPALFSVEWDTVVVDESHRALIKKGTTQTRTGMMKLRSRQRVALSGTPMRGKPEQLWGTLNWLRPDVYTSYWKWVAQYWEIYSTRFSAYNLGDFQPGGEDRLAEDLKPIMLRRTKQEVLPELPPKQYAGTYLLPDDEESPHGIWLSMTPEQEKRYRKFENEGTVQLPGGWLIANGTLAERTRKLQLAGSLGSLDGEEYRHALPSPKLDWLVQFLDELGMPDPEEDNRVIVSSYSTDLLKLYAAELRKLDIPVFLLTGETKGTDRAKMQRDFQSENPSARVFLLNAKAGGVALTLDMADYLVMVDESTVPDDDEQVEDRAHRTSRLHQLVIYKLRMLDTLEEEVAWIAAARENTQKYILDGARGVSYARNVYRRKAEKTRDQETQ
jgi:SNF2 family DNA or RNA helicase